MRINQQYWVRPLANFMRKNQTKEERHLWYDFLKNYPVKVMRQRVIGKYVADFYCAKAKLIVEVDGSQHYEELGLIHDEIRTEVLEKKGIIVIRFSNREINQEFESVCEKIDNTIRDILSKE